MKIPTNAKSKRNKIDLDIYFYERYDEHFLFNKISALAFLYESDSERTKEYQSFVYGLKACVAEDYDWRKSLAAEIYFSAFQQFEALFALLIAVFQPQPHWVFLNTYTSDSLKKNLNLFLQKEFSELAKGKAETEYDFINHAVYCDLNCENEKLWSSNLHNIYLVLQIIGQKYLDKLSEYNGYKHGLRISKASEMQLEIPGLHPIVMPDSLGYLDADKDDNSEDILIHRLYSINPQQSFYEMYLMHRLLRVIKSHRLADLKNDKVPVNSIDPMEMHFFGDLDVNRLKGSSSLSASVEL